MPVLHFQMEAQAAEIQQGQLSNASGILDVKIQNYDQDLRWLQDRMFMLELRIEGEPESPLKTSLKVRLNDLGTEEIKIETRRNAVHCAQAKLIDGAWPGC